MIKRELKVNFKKFVIWTAVLIGLFSMTFSLYPSITKEMDVSSVEKMLNTLPKEVVKSLNMDISAINTAYGWLKSEGFIFVLIITGVFASILGITILCKEESEKTIEYLNSLPVTRNKIVFNKVIVAIFYIVLQVLILGIFNFIGLKLSGEFDQKEYLCLSITPLFSALVIFSISLFISTFVHKVKKITGISYGLVFTSYAFQVISEISEEVEFLKYITPFTLANVRNTILESKLDIRMIILSILISAVFIGLSFVRYNKKSLV